MHSLGQWYLHLPWWEGEQSIRTLNSPVTNCKPELQNVYV